MVLSMGRLSSVRGVIDRRILANYRLDAAATAAVLPEPFRPKLVNGYAIGGLCLIRLKRVRPAFVPVPIGLSSENAAHRIAVQWDRGGQTHDGVYIPRRDTDSTINRFVGGRLSPGEHHHARFVAEESPPNYHVSFVSDDGNCGMDISARQSGTFPTDSVFESLESASRFFEAGSLGYSATVEGKRLDGLELDCHDWSVKPLEVQQMNSSFFDDPDRFPAGTATFDCALLMRGVEHAWHQRGSICCDGVA